MKLDILVIAAHPDDAELGCSGTVLKHIAAGKKAGIIDLTRGELGTRGTAETRDEEASEAAKILGVHVRENVKMRDGFFNNDEGHRLQLIRLIRKYSPEIILCNAFHDRHPDHGNAEKLINDAAFLSGLAKLKTELEGKVQKAWRPALVLQFIQDNFIEPDIVIDVTDFWDKKMESIRAYKTQFHNPALDEKQTYLSTPHFLKIIEGRAMEFGKHINAVYAEGFTCRKLLGVDNLFDLR